jgi:ABC-type sugar transport system substrate-binding protein
LPISKGIAGRTSANAASLFEKFPRKDVLIFPESIALKQSRLGSCGDGVTCDKLAGMKMAVRVLVGLVALVVIVLAIKYLNKSVPEPFSASAPAPQKIGETFTSAENGYSHRIPQGWESKPPPPSKVAMIVAPKSSGLSSNLVTTIEPYDGTLRAYVDDANIQPLKKKAVKAKVIRTDFTTDSKVSAYKVKLQSKSNNVDLAQTMYFFEGPGNKKIVITWTAPAQFQAGLEPLFDACMKTFALSTR